jgi:hypothetical protein
MPFVKTLSGTPTWGWWRYTTDWEPTEPAVMTATQAPTKIVIFDAGGVRDH